MKLHFLLLVLLVVQSFIANADSFFPKHLYRSNSRRLNTDSNFTTYKPGDPLRYVLLYATMYGEWNGAETISSQGDYFVQRSGNVVLKPSRQSAIDQSDTYTDSSTDSEVSESDENYSDTDFELVIFDGNATDKNSIQIYVNMAYDKFIYNSGNSSFSGTQMIKYTMTGDNTNTISDCSADISVFFLNISNSNSPALSYPHVPISDVGVQFQVTNSNCSISFTTSILTIISYADYALPVYILLMVAASILSSYFSYQRLKNFPENVDELKSMSVWSLWITSAWELFIIIFHIYMAIQYTRFYILIVSCLTFTVISMLRNLNKLILIVSRVERGDTLPLNSRMLVSLIPICLLCATYCVAVLVPKVSYLLLTGSLYMVPQIYRIWKRGERPSRYYLYNFSFAFSKIILVAYYLLYSQNVFQAPQNIPIACTFIGLILLQVVIMFIMRHLPQCMYAWRKYISKPSITVEGNEDCCICYEPLVADDLASLEKQLHDQIVQTPCRHKFHRRCIEEWIHLRESCPLDRKPLTWDDLMS